MKKTANNFILYIYLFIIMFLCYLDWIIINIGFIIRFFYMYFFGYEFYNSNYLI